jgi:PAS domain S-box-containing protein
MTKSGREPGEAEPVLSESFSPRRNEPLLREAADSAPAPVWMTNRGGAVEFINRAFCELTGIPFEKALGDAWLSVLHPDDIEEVREKRTVAWAAGYAPYVFEARFRRHDGAWRWFEVSSRPRIDDQGNFHGYVGLAVDRTEARSALEQLRASEERYRAVVENQSDLVCHFSADGTILFANAAYAKSIGVDPKQLLGGNLWKWVSEQDRVRVEEVMASLSPERPEARVENRFRTAEGERWMLWTNRALAFDGGGRWTEAQSTGVDIHDRKQAEEHTKLLLNELNHRVKNTLAVVQGIAHQTFKNTDFVARRAFEGRLSALSKAHSLLTERSWAPAPLGAVVEEVSHVCGAARERIRSSGPDVMLSPRQALSITMALHELCTNAVKYGALSSEAGAVEFGWSVNGGQIEMLWRESGGPRVSAPKERGYGSTMIERALARDLQGTAVLDFQASGVVCTIRAPLEF